MEKQISSIFLREPCYEIYIKILYFESVYIATLQKRRKKSKGKFKNYRICWSRRVHFRSSKASKKTV